MIRPLHVLPIGMLAAAWAMGGSPAAAQYREPAVFFCYVPDPSRGVTLISDNQQAGPTAERRYYSEQFVRFMAAQDRVSSGAQGYCNMQPRLDLLEKARADMRLPDGCPECAGANRMVDVRWSRKGGAPAPAAKAVVAAPSPKPPTTPAGRISDLVGDPVAAEAERPNFTVLVRTDAVDAFVTQSMGVSSDEAEVTSRARGGSWKPLMSDDRCSGWWAVSFINNGKQRHYWLMGGPTELDARQRALVPARRWEDRREGWDAGVILTFHAGEEAPVSAGDGAMNWLKGKVREMVTKPDQCRDADYTTVGVRG